LHTKPPPGGLFVFKGRQRIDLQAVFLRLQKRLQHGSNNPINEAGTAIAVPH
jgi:hypothetical protein